MADEPLSDTELGAEQCIRAGMYWFGRNDFASAESWWRKALELDPSNVRAHECLRLLSQSTTTGYKSSSWSVGDVPPDGAASPFVNESAPEASESPYLDPRPEDEIGIEVDTSGLGAPPPDTGPLEVLESGPTHVPRAVVDEPFDLATITTQGRARTLEPSRPGLTTDPLEFASQGDHYPPTSDLSAGPQSSPNPWDDGPARTGVVLVSDESGYDAMPDPTPLPVVDTNDVIGRVETKEEIETYLRATGDLPTQDAPPPGSVEERLRWAQDKFQLHDFAGVLEVLENVSAEGALAVEVAQLQAEARAQLMKMYESKVGDPDHCPRLLVSPEEVIWLNLNHRAGFLLAQIDGTVTFEDLLSLSGMPRLDTLKILSELLSQKVIA